MRVTSQSGNVQQRKLGNTGLNVSAIGFGCREMGNPEYGASNDEMIAAVNRAIDLGATLFDAAPRRSSGVRLERDARMGRWRTGC